MSYKNTNCSFFLILFKLLLLLIFYSADLAASVPCQSECGGIAIRYPFGIGKDCYLEKYYEIECRSTTTSRKLVPFLSVISKEVVSIYLPSADTFFAYPSEQYHKSFGVVRVKFPITSAGCSSDGKESGGSIMNFTGSPFFLDSTNSLIAAGCNSKVSLTSIKPNMVGCELNCNTSKDWHSNSIPFVDNTGCSGNILSYSQDQDCKEKKPEETECNGGNGCCQASLPNEPQQVIGIRTESNDGNSTTKKQCTIAFVSDEIYTLLNATNTEQLLAKGYATISLGWVIQTKNHSFLNSLACTNGEYNHNTTYFVEPERKCRCARITISEISYANCKCTYGYKGNPYMLDGCKGQYMLLPYALFLLFVCKHLLSFTNHF